MTTATEQKISASCGVFKRQMKIQVVRKGKNLAVGLIVLSVFSLMITSVQVSYAQQEVEFDDGGLTATLNGETFARGDPVTVRGTVAEREGGSQVYIDILDPDGIEHGTYTATVTNDLTFTYGLVAGQHRSMDKFGTYTIILTYFPPGRGSGIETTDVSFEYVSGTPTTGTTTTETETAVVNIAAMNQSIVQAMEYTEQATIAMQNNDTQAVFRNLDLVAKELESMQGNLTLTAAAAESSGGVNIDNNTSSETRTPSSPPTPPQQQEEQQPSPLPQSEQPVL